MKNTIKVWGSITLEIADIVDTVDMAYTVDVVYTVDMVNTVDMVDTVYTIQIDLNSLNSSWAGKLKLLICIKWLTRLRGMTGLTGLTRLKWHYAWTLYSIINAWAISK